MAHGITVRLVNFLLIITYIRFLIYYCSSCCIFSWQMTFPIPLDISFVEEKKIFCLLKLNKKVLHQKAVNNLSPREKNVSIYSDSDFYTGLLSEEQELLLESLLKHSAEGPCVQKKAPARGWRGRLEVLGSWCDGGKGAEWVMVRWVRAFVQGLSSVAVLLSLSFR